MDRKLASVRRVHSIEEIPGADRIEIAKVDGWQTVVKKGEFQTGDLCVYYEIDAFLPVREEFEFLRKSSFRTMADGSEGFRVKTIKLRGSISQGLIMPFTQELSDDIFETSLPPDDLIGYDLTAMLGVKKWEVPIPAQLSGIQKGDFPGFIRKTDEERVQNLADDYEELSEQRYYVTEKLDGTSGTYFIRDGEFGACSRNIELVETEHNTYWRIARLFNMKERMEDLKGNFAIQGEIIGEGIQSNLYHQTGQTIRIFNIFDIDKYEYVSFKRMKQMTAMMGLEMVPILDEDFELPPSLEDLLEYASAPSAMHHDTIREGIVIRSHDMKTSFKVISNDFILEHEQ